MAQLLDVHKSLFAKIQAERLDAQLPKTALVQITDTAESGRAPVKPNKTLNIFIGAVAGGFLGLVAATLSSLIAYWLGNRGRNNVVPA